MNRLVTAIGLMGVIYAGTPALGGEPAGLSRMSKRHATAQLSVCMKKRMSRDKGSSYNEARMACKVQIGMPDDKESSGSLVASARGKAFP